MKTIKLSYTKKGYSYIKCTKHDCYNWGGIAICDYCGKPMENEVYLIFVLARAYCPICFKEWMKRSKRYEDDIELQNRIQERWYLNYGFKTI